MVFTFLGCQFSVSVGLDDMIHMTHIQAFSQNSYNINLNPRRSYDGKCVQKAAAGNQKSDLER